MYSKHELHPIPLQSDACRPLLGHRRRRTPEVPERIRLKYLGGNGRGWLQHSGSRRFRLIQLALLACLAVGGLAAGFAGVFSAGGYNLLDSTPVIALGVVLALLFAGVRLLSSGSTVRGVTVLATLSWVAAVAVVLVRLAAAGVVPLDERDIQTWHLWPLFTLMGVVGVSTPLLMAALLLRLSSLLRHQKIGTRRWSFPAKLLLVATIAIAAAVALGPRVHQFIAVDACLDAGGAYDAIAGKCAFTESISQESSSPEAPWIDATSLGAGAVVSLLVLCALLAIDAMSNPDRRTR